MFFMVVLWHRDDCPSTPYCIYTLETVSHPEIWTSHSHPYTATPPLVNLLLSLDLDCFCVLFMSLFWFSGLHVTGIWTVLQVYPRCCKRHSFSLFYGCIKSAVYHV